jgi:nucleoside-diphosphate-sugar epimerase
LPGADIEICEDIADPIDWVPLLEGMDAVVHLAGVTSRPGISEERFDAVNHRATARLAAAARTIGVPLIFISAPSVQSGATADHELTEVDDPRPFGAHAGRAH